MKTTGPILMVILLSGFLAACSYRELTASPAEPTPDNVSLVQAYETAANAHDIDAVMSMFADDAVFELVGQGTLPNLEAIQAIHEYDKGINTQITLQNCTAAGQTVTCEVAEQNDWLSAAGLGEIFYPSSVFTLTETGKIQKISSTVSDEDGAAMGSVLAEFVPWLMTERPEESASLFSQDGQFIYSEENGVLVVDLLAQWQADQ